MERMETPHVLTAGSLFSGIGGFDLGLERAGFCIAWQSEIDPYACKVLEKHWPSVPNLGDIRGIDFEKVERVFLLAGGPPCQPVSLAGKRKGTTDQRWLWPEFARAIRILRPPYVIFENVPGILSKGGSDVLSDLAGLGYDAEWTVLSAADFGAPHLRRRVFIVAYPNREHDDNGRYGAGSAVRERPQAVKVSSNSLSPRFKVFQRLRFPSGSSGESVSDPGSWWASESGVDRVSVRVPHRVDRLRGLGNAVVPQIVEAIGRAILEGRVRKQRLKRTELEE
jgi:DNA (cytosine-5)-methyltransferase 1